MKKWAFLCATAAIVAIGCSGGGSSSSSTVTTGTGTTGGRPTVNLPASAGLIKVAYLTGQGRAPGSPTAVIERIFFVDQYSNQFPSETVLNPDLNLGLDQYSVQEGQVNMAIPTGEGSRFFDEFHLQVSKLRVETAGGGSNEFTGPNGDPVVDETFAAAIRVFRGRHTTVPIYLDDAMLNIDPGTGDPAFDRGLFELINYDQFDNRINGFLSDYVSFDISAMASVDRPTMSGGAPASRAFFSGDNYAISTGGSTGPFEVLIPTGFIEGTFTVHGAPINTNTYTLMQLDPRDLTNTMKITALLGDWRHYTSVLGNLGTVNFITFPKSDDSNLQDLVIFQLNAGGEIVDMYFGFADFSINEFYAWPIRNLDDGAIDNEITGTLTDYVGGDGLPVSATPFHGIRGGDYAINPGPNVPASFPTSGEFTVYRR